MQDNFFAMTDSLESIKNLKIELEYVYTLKLILCVVSLRSFLKYCQNYVNSLGAEQFLAMDRKVF